MTTPEVEVRVAWSDPDEVSESALLAADTWLRDDERARLLRLRAPGAARLSRIGRALARILLAERTGTTPADWWFAIGAHGRPVARCVRRMALPAPSVNVSHCSSLVVAALADNAPIGVDVECVDRPPPSRRPERFLAAEEMAWLERCGPDERQEGFWRLWTLKEAWLKARGTGIAGSLRSFSVSPDPHPPRLTVAPPGEAPSAWAFHEPAAAPRHRLAVAVRTAADRVQWRCARRAADLGTGPGSDAAHSL